MASLVRTVASVIGALSLVLLAACGPVSSSLDALGGVFVAQPNDRGVGAVPGKGIYYQDRVVVLMYHDVSAKPLNNSTLPLDKFEKQLQLMKDAGFNWITMDQYADFVAGHAEVPPNAVLLTFDDGYASFYTDTYPVLRKFNAPATQFLIVSTIGQPSGTAVPKLTWDQARVMKEAGIDFYSHTYDSHKKVKIDAEGKKTRSMLYSPMYDAKLGRKETPEEYRARMREDLAKANDILKQQLGNERSIIAFPYGAFTKTTLEVCRELGVDITFTVKRGINKAGDLNGFRVNAGGMDNDPETLIEDMKTGIADPNAAVSCPDWMLGKPQSGGGYTRCGWGMLGPSIAM